LALDAHPLAGLPLPKLPDVLVESLREREMRALGVVLLDLVDEDR